MYFSYFKIYHLIGKQTSENRSITIFSQLRTFARKTSTIQIFFILWLQSDNELRKSEMQENWGSPTSFSFSFVKNYPNFDTSVLVTRHGLSAC